jgi:hypothetical protein
VISRLIRRFRLWLWDQENAGILALAERRQTAHIGAYLAPCPRLDSIIRVMRRDRARIERGLP